MTLGDPLSFLFLAAVAAGWRLLAARGRAGVAFLAASSLLFYATWNPLCVLPLLVTAAVDHAVGRALGRERRRAVRRLLVLASLVADLGLLAFFKYGNLLGATLAPLVHPGSPDAWPPFRIAFAAGISFYTFQSLSYVIDVYRGDQEPAGSFLDYLAFVSFFPTLLAGPITRAETLLPQLRRGPAVLSDDVGGRALFLIALGLVKKFVIADTLAVNLVNRVFEVPGLYTSTEVLAGVYGYAAQIYCDFSGYSDLAIGFALLLGVKLKDNFNSPYRSSDLAEFWRRWHISLSTWLRDYLFFSLPGNRTALGPYLNLVVTFTLGGLWHGASWTFAVWGLMHGAGLAFVRLLEQRRRRAGGVRPQGRLRRLSGSLVTFHFVLVTWVFFRCSTLSEAADVFRVLADRTTGLGNVSAVALLAIVVALFAQALPEEWLPRATARFSALPAPAQAALLLAVAAGVRLAAGSAVAPFIYFGF